MTKISFTTHQTPSSFEWDGTLRILVSTESLNAKKKPLAVERWRCVLSSPLLFGTTDKNQEIELEKKNFIIMSKHSRE